MPERALPSSVDSPQPTSPLSVVILTSRARGLGQNCSTFAIFTRALLTSWRSPTGPAGRSDRTGQCSRPAGPDSVGRLAGRRVGDPILAAQEASNDGRRDAGRRQVRDAE